MQRVNPGSRDFYEGIIAIVSEKQSVHPIWIPFPRTRSAITSGYDLYNKVNIVAYSKGVMRWLLSDWTCATLQWVMDWDDWAVILVMVPEDGEYIGVDDNNGSIAIKLFDIEVENLEEEKVVKFQLPISELQLLVGKNTGIAEAVYLLAKMLLSQTSYKDNSLLDELEGRLGFPIDIEEGFPTTGEMSWDDYLDELPFF